MLVLTRRDCESLIVGDDVKISVIGVHNGVVRFGIDAPKEIPIHREEIYNKIIVKREAKLTNRNKL